MKPNKLDKVGKKVRYLREISPLSSELIGSGAVNGIGVRLSCSPRENRHFLHGLRECTVKKKCSEFFPTRVEGKGGVENGGKGKRARGKVENSRCRLLSGPVSRPSARRKLQLAASYELDDELSECRREKSVSARGEERWKKLETNANGLRLAHPSRGGAAAIAICAPLAG